MKINKLFIDFILIGFLLTACATKPAPIATQPRIPNFVSAEEHLARVKKALEEASTVSEKIDAIIQGF